MTETIGISGQEESLDLGPTLNLSPTQMGASITFTDFFDWLFVQDVEDAADARETLGLYRARGLQDFVRVR